MKSIFREYDIRGIFQKELNENIVKKIGYFLGQKAKAVNKNAVVTIGYDARIHSSTLKNWLTSGFNLAGVKVLNMGLVATPVNYFANYFNFDGLNSTISVMVTGSHNPPEYNGFKITLNKVPFFGKDIYALGEEILSSDIEIKDNLTSTFIEAKEAYIKFMIDEFSHLKSFSKKLVFDCGNGAANSVLEDILKGLDLNYKLLYKEPDGTFPNHHPDPSEEESLIDIKKELESDFEFGFAYDGDADRIAMLSKKYNFKGDVLALFFAKNILNPIVIGEVKCSQIMYDEINKIGKAVMYKTGHSNLKVKIKELNASFAAEVSGHLFFNDRYFGFDDAIYATLRAIELLHNGFNFDAEYEKLPKLFSTEEIKIKTTEEDKFKIIKKLKELLKKPSSDFPKIKDIIDIDGVRVIFDEGWGLVRASNTTPILVTRFEAISENSAKLYEDNLNKLIEKAKDSI